jgi:hypothetical protein
MKTRTSIVTVHHSDYAKVLADLSAQGRPPLAVERRKGRGGVVYRLTVPVAVAPVLPRSRTHKGRVQTVVGLLIAVGIALAPMAAAGVVTLADTADAPAGQDGGKAGVLGGPEKLMGTLFGPKVPRWRLGLRPPARLCC